MEEAQIVNSIREILSIDVGDGILFEYTGIEPICEEEAYNNFRVHIQARYGKIDNPMKIDITTGDIITPAAIQYDFPMIFDDKKITVMAYTLETVLAEKYETIIRRNISTTRARDYYDLYTLFNGRRAEINIDFFRTAVLHTAKKRGSIPDIEDWRAIINEIHEEPQLRTLWNSYISENKYIGELDFEVIFHTLEEVAKLLDL